jgi:hypothetical protein
MRPLNYFLISFSMYLNLLSEVTIGSFTTRAITSGEIKSSWKEITDTCQFTMPRNLFFKGKRIDEVVQVGDEVSVRLSATGEKGLATEFQGYVREIETTVPLKIHCEDDMWLLKRVPLKAKSWANAEIKDVIDYVLAGTSVKSRVFENNSINVTLGKYQINNKSAAQVLYDLRDWGIQSYFRDKVLHVGFAYDYTFNNVTVHFQKNVKKNDLKFRLAGDYKIKVKAIANLPTGQKTIVNFPDEVPGEAGNSELRTLNFGELSTDLEKRKVLLRRYAEEEIKKFNVDGYRGTITLFGITQIKHGDNVVLQDLRYPERVSTNIADSVVTRWGAVYYDKQVEIGPRVSPVQS